MHSNFESEHSGALRSCDLIKGTKSYTRHGIEECLSFVHLGVFGFKRAIHLCK